MKCRQDYCIYNEDFFCILDGIEINELGMCEACIIVSIPDNELKILKESLLEQYGDCR